MKEGRGLSAKRPSSSSRSKTGEGSGAERRPVRGRGRRRFPAMAAARKWPKMARRPRGIDPRAYLALGWSEGVAPREGGGSVAVLKGAAALWSFGGGL
jgi:hypothetical protein